MTFLRLIAILAAFVAACAFVPSANPRLDEAKEQYEAALREPMIQALAPQEMQRAAEALARATRAHDTLDDPAAIDHLAYIARQQVAIAREAARMRGYDRDPRLTP